MKRKCIALVLVMFLISLFSFSALAEDLTGADPWDKGDGDKHVHLNLRTREDSIAKCPICSQPEPKTGDKYDPSTN